MFEVFKRKKEGDLKRRGNEQGRGWDKSLEKIKLYVMKRGGRKERRKGRREKERRGKLNKIVKIKVLQEYMDY